MLALVGEDGDDDFSLAELLRDARRRRARGAGGQPDDPAFFRREAPRVVHRLLVAHLEDLVDHLTVQDRGHEARADALDFVKARLAAREHRGGEVLKDKMKEARIYRSEE